MIIAGFDPGTARLGWAILKTNGTSQNAEAYGCIITEANVPAAERLFTIYTDCTKILEDYRPDCVAVEELYFATNAKTVIPVAQARGIVLLAAAQQKLSVVSYSPLAVKRTICGFGKAEKTQVQKMVVRLLHLKEAPKLDDTADALAIALTHAYSYKWKEKTA